LLGVLAAAFALVALPPRFPRVGAELAALRAESAARRRELSVQVSVAVLGALLGLIAVTRVALRVLVAAEPARASGAVLGLAAGALALGVFVAARGAGALAAARASSWSPDPVRFGGSALLAGAGAVAVLVA